MASRLGSIVALMSTLLAACSGSRPPDLNVEAQWDDAMRRLGLFAFYPATENAEPGDVFLLVPPPYGKLNFLRRQWEYIFNARPLNDTSRFSLLRIGKLGAKPSAATSVLEHLREQYSQSLLIQPLTTDTTIRDRQREAGYRAPGSAVMGRGRHPHDVGHADQDVLTPRLRRGAIPALSVARLTEAQLSASGLFGNIGAALGFSRGSETALTISLQDVQELQLDAARAAALYQRHAPDFYERQATASNLLHWLDTLRHGRSDLFDLVPAACNGNRKELQDQGVQIAVITRVLYAGTIDYSFSDRTATAIRGALDLQNALAAAVRQPAETPRQNTPQQGAPAGGTPPTPPATVGSGAGMVAEQNRRALSERNASLPSIAHRDTRAGITTTVGISNFGTLSLREVFNRAIAVGAGSRYVIGFHEALAGRLLPARERDYQTLTERFLDAARYCTEALAARKVRYEGRERLWEAMSPSRQRGPAPQERVRPS